VSKTRDKLKDTQKQTSKLEDSSMCSNNRHI